jgi:hypothetical protein
MWEQWTGRDLQKITEKGILSYHSLYNIIARKFLWNYVTIIMILESPDDVVASVSALYQVVSHDQVHECIIYDNTCSGDRHTGYLDNLSNINKKFTVIKGGNNRRQKQEIKSALFTKPEHGIIMYVDDNAIGVGNGVAGVGTHLIDTLVDLMYDESIGMLGLVGGTIQKGSKGAVQTIANVPSDQVSECLVGWQIFRTELRLLGLKIETQFESQLSDLDFSFQVRSLGKVLMLLPSHDLVAPPKVINFSKDQWSLFNKKWTSYPK